MKGKDTMKAVIGTLAIVLGLSPLLLAAEGEKSPTVLYQEALYQEETEGNLDQAIELYGQVLEQAAGVEYLTARSLYQLGMCHLKKGDKDTAAVFFRDVVQDYSKQTSVVKKAKVQLDKIAPEGVVRKITLPDADTPDANVVLDLASGELLPAVSGQKQLTLFRDFGKGDLAYDRQLICLRGAKASLIVHDLSGEHTAPLEIMQQIEGVMTEYSLDLVPIPGEYLVTTAEGDDYKVDILSADSNGMQLSYKTYDRTAHAPQKKTFTIYDNNAFDLDSNTIITVDSSDILNEFDIGWDNDGGGALMGNPKGSSSVVGLAGIKQGDWGEAIESAQKSLPLLKKGGSRGIVANTASFCAVLTDQGNLYVVEITDYSSEKATLNVLRLEDSIKIEVSPETPAGLRSLSKRYMETGDYDKGVKCYVKWMGLEATGNQLFEALNKLIEEGEPAVEPLIQEMKTSYNWQVPKALGAIGDRRAVGSLIDKWEQNNTSPMKDVVQESLELITGQQYGDNLDEWKTWWEGVKDTYTPQATISGFMQAALKFDVDKAMSHVAPESHDYGDIKEIFESPENPFYQMFKKADTSVPIKVTRADISDTMCSAAWEFTLKEDFNFGNKLTLKAGDTFELDGNLRQYGEKWLITGI